MLNTHTCNDRYCGGGDWIVFIDKTIQMKQELPDGKVIILKADIDIKFCPFCGAKIEGGDYNS